MANRDFIYLASIFFDPPPNVTVCNGVETPVVDHDFEKNKVERLAELIQAEVLKETLLCIKDCKKMGAYGAINVIKKRVGINL